MAVTAPRRADALRESIAPFLRFFTGAYSDLEKDPETANFAVGNPHELAMPSYVDALRNSLEPRNKDWFAYKQSEPEATTVVAKTMSSLTGLPWDPADVNMTNGGFAALAVTLRTLLEPDDEAIFLSAPWFFYELLILAANGTPVRAHLSMPDGALDLDAINEAITPKTKLLLLNTPHNPSGRVLELDELQSVADLLTRKSQDIGHPIYIVSDEPYRRIVFDGRDFHSPAEVYAHTVVAYSYGKQLLAPGMRIGYFTWPPTMPNREKLRDDAFVTQIAAGYSFPNADLQHALAEIETQCVSIEALERRRERLIKALREIGYDTTWPQGTFYVMARSPLADDEAFTKILNKHKVLVLPGTVVEVPGWFRISLTASDDMVERGIGGFKQGWEEAQSR